METKLELLKRYSTGVKSLESANLTADAALVGGVVLIGGLLIELLSDIRDELYTCGGGRLRGEG